MTDCQSNTHVVQNDTGVQFLKSLYEMNKTSKSALSWEDGNLGWNIVWLTLALEICRKYGKFGKDNWWKKVVHNTKHTLRLSSEVAFPSIKLEDEEEMDEDKQEY